MQDYSRTYKFKVHSLRKHPDPQSPTRTRYTATANVKDLPANLPMEANPRSQNLDSKVAKKIRKGLHGDPVPNAFHLLNRGMLISANEARFNNDTSELVLSMTDSQRHGVVDGGHTYKIVLEERDSLTDAQFVQLEVMTGIEEDFDDIAGARNTSMQVKDKSLAELSGNLVVIKEIVAGLPFEHDIAYRENDDKEIDVLEVIAILSMFNVDLNGENSPIYAYNSRQKALQTYLQNIESFRKLKPVAERIFALHDEIKKTMPELYQGGRFGALKEIGYADGAAKYELRFLPKVAGDFEKVPYDVPAGFVYPILGSLRYLIEDDGDAREPAYKWRTNAKKFYAEKVGKELIAKTFQASKDSGRNATAVGKKPAHWQGLYDYVARVFLESERS